MHDPAVVGFDTATIDRWLPTVVDLVPPLTWTRLPGGHSNLTYQVDDASGRQLVIRRPPLGHLLPKAHDMGREHRVISGLWATAVPVPEPIAFVDDRDLCDTPFYVMGKVDGEALMTGELARQWLTPDGRQRIGVSFIEVLATLHSLDPGDVGLSDLGRPGGYVSRQLATWYGSWTASIDAAAHDDPRVHALFEWLSSHVPDQGSGRIVHGDYGLHNVLVSADGEVTAVLDWEIATLGDPLADFAYALNAWAEPGDVDEITPDPPSAVAGFCSRDDLVDGYVAATGADVRDLAYYRMFNYFKTACILHGVYSRYRAGQKSSEGVDLEALFARMQRAVSSAEELSASS
jgi:aminoglycoside phosphotransferase (APT) family kinase protein